MDGFIFNTNETCENILTQSFADIRVSNTSIHYNASCLVDLLVHFNGTDPFEEATLDPSDVRACSTTTDGGGGGGGGGGVEEEIPYVAGNMLWAIYQFTVVIVLLSVLRARMVNTYHRIFKEADVQWKYFR